MSCKCLPASRWTPRPIWGISGVRAARPYAVHRLKLGPLRSRQRDEQCLPAVPQESLRIIVEQFPHEHPAAARPDLVRGDHNMGMDIARMRYPRRIVQDDLRGDA